MKRLLAILIASAKRFERNDGWAHCSHIALSLLIALFPFCIFTLSLAGQLSSDMSASDLVHFVLGAWPDQLSEPIEREIAAVLEASGSTSLTMNAFLTIYFASNGVDAIRTAIAGAYHEADLRPFWKTRLQCIVFVIVAALLLSAAGVLTVVLPVYFKFFQSAAPSLYSQVFSNEPLRVAIAVILLLFLLIASHIWLPGHKRSLRSLMPGISLTIILWALCAQGFSAYIRNFGFYSVTYAGLAGIMASLVFMYLMAAIFIFGAEFNGQLADETDGI